MPFYTGIFTIRDSVEILQTEAGNQWDALRELIGQLPYDDAYGMSEADHEVVGGIISGASKPELSLVTGKSSIWYWLDGSRLDDRIHGYIIKTAEA